MARKHYVTFMSPGTLFAEQSSKEISEWDPVSAMRMATEIRERYNAKPYGFRFETRIVHDPITDGEGGTLRVEPKTVAQSGIYYINGVIKRYDEIPDDKEHDTLRSNMRCNEWPVVVETRNGFRWTAPFGEGDAVVNADGIVTARGNDYAIAAYRAS